MKLGKLVTKIMSKEPQKPRPAASGRNDFEPSRKDFKNMNDRELTEEIRPRIGMSEKNLRDPLTKDQQEDLVRRAAAAHKRNSQREAFVKAKGG